MKICKLPTAIVRFDNTSYLYILPFFSGASVAPKHLVIGAQPKIGALGYRAPVSLFPVEYGYHHSNVLLHLITVKIFVSSQVGALQASCHPMKLDVINDVKLFPTVSILTLC